MYADVSTGEDPSVPAEEANCLHEWPQDEDHSKVLLSSALHVLKRSPPLDSFSKVILGKHRTVSITAIN